jgi:hypothetical protein
MYRTRIAAIFVVILALSGSVAFAQEAGSTKVNVNTATPEELAHLPGMTKGKAAKVIAGRPYASTDDLSKSGLTAKQIEKIRPLVSYEGGAASAALPAAAATSATGAPSTAKPGHARKASNTASMGSASAESGTPQVPPQPGMVWANAKSKVYHVEGDRYYGKTKNGQWMTEAEAIKAGYRKSKQHVKND